MIEKHLQPLQDAGWLIDCESPFELSHPDGSRATGQAADIVVAYLEEEELYNKREGLTEFEFIKRNLMFLEGCAVALNLPRMVSIIDNIRTNLKIIEGIE